FCPHYLENRDIKREETAGSITIWNGKARKQRKGQMAKDRAAITKMQQLAPL
ncbi:MAG: hypothetical protein IM576_16340, partial [Pseudanabaena sp. M074S1SP2A07QC]|nr:hypothetical protein [Pseudanabaena sp. M074S1SP2A07QC]